MLGIITLLGGCWPESEWGELRGSSTDCILAIFPAGTTDQEINSFLSEHTQAPAAPRGGQPLRDVISAVIKRGIEGQIGYEICFRKNGDPAEINSIREGIKRSHLPERVLEGKEAELAVYGPRS